MAPTHRLAFNLPDKCNGSKLPNTNVISLNFQKNYLSGSVHYSQVCKLHSYSDSPKIVKPPIIHHLLLQFKWPTAKLVLVIALILSQKPFILKRT